MKVGDLVRVTYGNPVAPETATVFGLIVDRASLTVGYPRTNHIYLTSGQVVRHVSDNYLEVVSESR